MSTGAAAAAGTGGRPEGAPRTARRSLWMASLVFTTALAVGVTFLINRYVVGAGVSTDSQQRTLRILTWNIGGQEIRLRAGSYKRLSNYDTQNNSGFIMSTGYVARF